MRLCFRNSHCSLCFSFTHSLSHCFSSLLSFPIKTKYIFSYIDIANKSLDPFFDPCAFFSSKIIFRCLSIVRENLILRDRIYSYDLFCSEVHTVFFLFFNLIKLNWQEEKKNCLVEWLVTHYKEKKEIVDVSILYINLFTINDNRLKSSLAAYTIDSFEERAAI